MILRKAAACVLVLSGLCLLMSAGAASAQGSFFKQPPATQPKSKKAPAPTPPATSSPPQTVTPQPVKTEPAKPLKTRPVKSQVVQKPPPPATANGAFAGMTAGNVVLVGGAKFSLPDLASGPPPADGAALAAWVEHEGGNLKCGPFGGHQTCLTAGGHDLGFALVFNGLAAPASGAPHEFQLAYAAVQLRSQLLGQDSAGLMHRLVAGSLAPSCQFIFTCGRRMASTSGYGVEQQAFARQDWPGLVHTIMDINYKMDLNYYYLGRAAEALGAVKAANAYYFQAASLYLRDGDDNHCRGHSEPLCGNLNLEAEIEAHARAIKALAPYAFN
jgi:hypothetical protein